MASVVCRKSVLIKRTGCIVLLLIGLLLNYLVTCMQNVAGAYAAVKNTNFPFVHVLFVFEVYSQLVCIPIHKFNFRSIRS